MKKNLSLLGSSFLLGLLSLLPKKAYATSIFGFSQPDHINFGNFKSSFPQIFGWVVVIAGVLFVVMFLIGGIQYLSSSGNEEAANKAKKLLIDAVIGILVVAISWAVGQYIISQLFTAV